MLHRFFALICVACSRQWSSSLRALAAASPLERSDAVDGEIVVEAGSSATKPLAMLMLGDSSTTAFQSADLPAASFRASRASPPVADLFKNVKKSGRVLTREAWEKADAFRPGKANWFTKEQKDLLALHEDIAKEVAELEEKPPATNETSLLGSLLKVLSTGDLAITLCSPEPPVLTEMRDWLVAEFPLNKAVEGLPDEQGRVLATLVHAIDGRKMLDLGTFTGYSSISMALASADDARIICCEPAEEYAQMAREWWDKAGCASKLEMHECGAEELMAERLKQGEAGTYDFVFCDVGDRTRYAACHEQILQLLRVGGCVVYYGTLWAADDIIQHGPYPMMREFNAALVTDPRVLCTLVPLSYGITICVKTMELDSEKYAAAASAGIDKVRELILERRARAEEELAALG